MKFTYDKDVRALYIQIADGAVTQSREIREGVVADFDQRGQLLGVEIIDEQDFLAFVGEHARGGFTIPDIRAI